MKLSFHAVTLTNFKAIKGPLEWRFHDKPGVYLVYGENRREPSMESNGAAKSTLLDGIYWALTGKTIASSRPGEDVENWNVDKPSVTAALSVSLDNDTYEIVRTRRPNNLSINGVTVEQKELDSLIPLSDNAKRHTIIIGQESELFLSLNSDAQSHLFTSTLGLDRWLKASDRASAQAKDLDREQRVLENRMAELRGSIGQVQDQFERACEQEARFEGERQERLHSLRRQLGEQEERLAGYRDALERAQAALSGLPVIGGGEDLAALRARQRGLSEQRALKGNLARTEREKSGIFRKMIAEYRAQRCPECHQPVSDEKREKRISELKDEITRADKFADEFSAEFRNIEETIAQLNYQISDREEITKFQINVDNEKHSINQQTALINTTKAMLREQEQQTNRFSKICDDLETQFKQLVADKKALQASIDSLNSDNEILKFWQQGFREIRLEQIETVLAELEVATNRNAIALGLLDWEIQFSTERENKSGSVTQAFATYLFPPGQAKPIRWTCYSGGERKRWQLAATMGLSEVLLSRAGIFPDIEFFDEQMEYLSNAGMTDLIECLHERAVTLGRRIYVIEHHSLDKGGFDAIVKVVKDADGVHLE